MKLQTGAGRHLGWGSESRRLDSGQRSGEVMDFVEGACDELPSEYADQCKAAVEMYGPQIIKMLEAQLDPNTVCATLGLCAQSAGEQALSPVKLSAKKEVQTEEVGNTVTCEVCNIFMGELTSTLKDNATEAEIKQAVTELCGKLPAHLNDECSLLVTEYIDLIIKVILTEDPSVVCQYVGLCPSFDSARVMSAPAGLKVLLKYGEDIPTHPCCQRSHTNRYSCFSQEWTGFKASRDPYDHTAEIAQYEEKLSKFHQGLAAKLETPHASLACIYWMGGEGK